MAAAEELSQESMRTGCLTLGRALSAWRFKRDRILNVAIDRLYRLLSTFYWAGYQPNSNWTSHVIDAATSQIV